MEGVVTCPWGQVTGVQVECACHSWGAGLNSRCLVASRGDDGTRIANAWLAAMNSR
jgi:hypothetical protein